MPQVLLSGPDPGFVPVTDLLPTGRPFSGLWANPRCFSQFLGMNLKSPVTALRTVNKAFQHVILVSCPMSAERGQAPGSGSPGFPLQLRTCWFHNPETRPTPSEPQGPSFGQSPSLECCKIGEKTLALVLCALLPLIFLGCLGLSSNVASSGRPSLTSLKQGSANFFG